MPHSLSCFISEHPVCFRQTEEPTPLFHRYSHSVLLWFVRIKCVRSLSSPSRFLFCGWLVKEHQCDALCSPSKNILQILCFLMELHQITDTNKAVPWSSCRVATSPNALRSQTDLKRHYLHKFFLFCFFVFFRFCPFNIYCSC